ncbi:MAG TPA: hypothetical protein VMV50_02985 [Candidatus Paceibacterota bacterium]|nr:hypothetical protein [Candidatus Paceibacterota bacterium]
MKILILYMPVLHAGYLKLFDEVKPKLVALITEDVLRDLPEGLAYIAKKDIIRAVPAETMSHSIRSLLGMRFSVVLAEPRYLSRLADDARARIVMPEEDVSTAIAEKYFGGSDRITFVVPSAPRLRYHRDNVEEKKLLVPERRIALTGLDREMMARAEGVAPRSPDWWRQVGGVMRLADGRSIVAFNELQPHEQIAATFGDPRSIFKSGVRTELSSAEHVEHILIGEAARRGICTEGSQLYITDFPCLACARLSIRSGVKCVFYGKPSYGLLDADSEFRNANVELVEVVR